MQRHDEEIKTVHDVLRKLGFSKSDSEAERGAMYLVLRRYVEEHGPDWEALNAKG